MAKDQDFEKDFVRLKNVSKIYRMGEVEIRAVDKIEFAIDKGEFVVVVGPSGAGKTTVLNILGGMDTVTSGDVLVDGENIANFIFHTSGNAAGFTPLLDSEGKPVVSSVWDK